MKKITVIVPVYNSEDYIQRCLDSLINQSIIEQMEIIVINDGTKDNSEEIINQYLIDYPNSVKYFKKENEGLSSTRNLGITLSETPYIGFVDSDDYVEKEMFEKLLFKIEKENADISICGIEKCFMNGEYLKNEEIFDATSISCDMGLQMFLKGELKAYACNKLFRTSIIKKNKILFPTGQLYEDTIFFIKILKFSNKITFVDEILYYYVQHQHSICSNPTIKTANDILNNIDHLTSLEIKSPIFNFNTLIQSYMAYLNFKYENKNRKILSEELAYLVRLKKYKSKIKFKEIMGQELSKKDKLICIGFHLNLLEFIWLLKKIR